MAPKPLTFDFADDGVVPNNALPVVVFEGALDLAHTGEPAAARRCFGRTAGAATCGATAYSHSCTITR